jgi:enamine deaminase RidA (YjgF/YER057c/UK114 family)
MPIHVMNPAGLAKTQTHAQVAVATGSRTIYLAGQVGQDIEGKIVGVGDLAAQTEQALVNVSTALRAAGASFSDVAKVTIYVARWKPEYMPAFLDGWGRAAARLGIDAPRPTTFIGVDVLFHPDILIEFDVTAVIA